MPAMSRLVARLLLSMLMFPLAVTLYGVVMAIAETTFRSVSYNPGNYRQREELMFLSADLITWSGVAAYWCLLWRSNVRWNARRIGGTLGAVVAAIVVGGGIGLLFGASFGSGSDTEIFTVFLGGVLAILLWLFATVFLWRETPAERAARVGAAGGSAVACPTCGYNLTGLGEARCPECGSRFTLDELLAAQPARVAAADLD